MRKRYIKKPKLSAAEQPSRQRKTSKKHSPAAALQESPKNILNILDDDCLQAILRRLDDVHDFYKAAKVCIRFQENAKLCFPFKIIRFWFKKEKESNRKNNCSIYSRGSDGDINVKEFLILFGPRIKSIILYHKAELYFNLISLYCGQTLIALEITGPSSPTYQFRFRSQFPALQILIISCAIVDFRTIHTYTFPELKILELCCDEVRWIAHRFPKLEYFNFNYSCPCTDTLIKFQNLNPQLKSIRLMPESELDAAVCRDIENRLPNIVSLFLNIDEIPYRSIEHMSKFRCLKNVYPISSELSDPTVMIKFLSSLIDTNQPIEEIVLQWVDHELGKMLQKMKTIKRLFIYKLRGDLIDIAKNLPALEYLEVDWIICPWELRKILENCKNLKGLACRIDQHIEMDQYNLIVALVTGRVYVTFHCWFLNSSVVNKVEQMHQKGGKWVRVIKGRDHILRKIEEKMRCDSVKHATQMTFSFE